MVVAFLLLFLTKSVTLGESISDVRFTILGMLIIATAMLVTTRILDYNVVK
jgi:hypothetical protein